MNAPPIPYFGSKATLAPQIVAAFPPHEHYVEPFAGSLAVLLAKPRSRMETVNDLDGDLMTFWRVLRDQPDELTRVCESTPHSRAEHDAAYDRDGCDDLERARRVWVCLTQGRGGSLIPTGWRFDRKDAGHGATVRKIADHPRRIAPAAARLAGVSLECRPALDIVRAYGTEPSVLLYVDPPYVGDARGENGRSRYRCDMTDPADHRELLAALLGCRAAVVLSGYLHPLYADALTGWHVLEMSAQTHERNERTEVLWSNRPLGRQASLFDGEVTA